MIESEFLESDVVLFLHDQALRDIDQALKAPGVKLDFCKDWPIARAILELLAKIPVLAIPVGIVLAIGNAYYKAHCKQ